MMKPESTGLALVCLALAACGGGSEGTDGGGGGDASVADAAGPDAPPTPCGNGVVDPGEVCDGNTESCDDLGGTWMAGTSAGCRADCRAWDTSVCTLAQPGQWEAVTPAARGAAWNTARCNDGTPFAFVVRMASPASSNWVIYLQGGVYCDDYSFPCVSRDPTLTTTLPFADGSLGPAPFGGILTTSTAVNPDFAGANQVFAHYCSSDVWAGATTDVRPTAGIPGGWYFSGHTNVDAMIQVLVQRYLLDDTNPATRVLFGGGSAGAFGAHFNIARVESELPNAAAAGRLMLLVDAGWYTDWDDPAHRLGSATTSDHDVFVRARAFWGATFDPDCEAQETDPVDCNFAPVWYPYVSARVPTFIQQSLTDASFTGVHGIMQTDTATVDIWRTQVTASLLSVDWLFAGDAFYHTLGLDDAGFQMGPSGSSFQETLGRFWNGGAAERVIF